jgi:hypothetical protein
MVPKSPVCRGVWFAAVFLLAAMPAAAAVRGDKAAYVDGTVSQIKRWTQGNLDLSDAEVLRFRYQGGTYELPYERITTMESGQKVGRRIGVAVAVNPLALFSKKRKHYLTLGVVEDSADGFLVFELAKNIVESTEALLQARTGRTIERTAPREEFWDLDDGEEERWLPSRRSPVHDMGKPPQRAASPQVHLAVTSTPPGAQIELDGRAIAITPATLTVEAGRRTIVVRKPGFAVWVKTTEVAAGSPALHADLQPNEPERPMVIKIQPKNRRE